MSSEAAGSPGLYNHNMSIANLYQFKAMAGLQPDDVREALRHIDDALANLREDEDPFVLVQIERRLLGRISEDQTSLVRHFCDVIGGAESLRDVADKLPVGNARTALSKAVAALWDRTPSRTYRS